MTSTAPSDGTGIIDLDPWLEPFREAIKRRFNYVESWIKTVDEVEGGLDKFSKGYEKFGFNVSETGDITYREWAPNAIEAALVGDFNNWDTGANPMTRDDFGVWEIVLPARNGTPVIPHDSKVKVCLWHAASPLRGSNAVTSYR
jgi:1,4-alpha-glucan branching enzyme